MCGSRENSFPCFLSSSTNRAFAKRPLKRFRLPVGRGQIAAAFYRQLESIITASRFCIHRRSRRLIGFNVETIRNGTVLFSAYNSFGD